MRLKMDTSSSPLSQNQYRAQESQYRAQESQPKGKTQNKSRWNSFSTRKKVAIVALAVFSATLLIASGFGIAAAGFGVGAGVAAASYLGLSSTALIGATVGAGAAGLATGIGAIVLGCKNKKPEDKNTPKPLTDQEIDERVQEEIKNMPKLDTSNYNPSDNQRSFDDFYAM